MASTFALARDPEAHHLSPSVLAHQHHLSPSPAGSQFASPSHTPAVSSTNLSNYQSELGDFDLDPFFGADLADVPDNAQSFFGQPSPHSSNVLVHRHEAGDGTSYPLTPSHTASVHSTTPRSELRDAALTHTPDPPMLWISPQQLQNSFAPAPTTVVASDLTPSRTSSGRTSEDGLAPPAPVAMDPPSPRVTVSVWDKGFEMRAPPVERGFDDCPTGNRGDMGFAGDLISSTPAHSFVSPQSVSHRRGLGPERRQSDETSSINEMTAQRKARDRDQQVDRWLAERLEVAIPHHSTEIRAIEQFTSGHDDGIPLGDQTENKPVAGQTYYHEQGSGPMTQMDRDIIAADHKWADAPVLPHITQDVAARGQPQTSQAAIEKFERMCRDNDSIISRSATWGTRRRSHPSVLDLAVESGTTGGFLKKLTMNLGNGDKSSKSGSLLKDLRGLVRRPSVNSLRKRSRSRPRSDRNDETAAQQLRGEQQVKCENTPHVSPTLTTSSWGRKSSPSLNTTLASMAYNFVTMGSSRSRSGSIGVTTQAASGKNSANGNLSVRSTLRRPRSKSEIPKASVTPTDPTESHPNLVGMWIRSGGPPVATFAKSSDAHVDDEDEDDDDELYDENDVRTNPNIIDDISPTFAGFRQHVLALNPGLDQKHGYLIDRIAQQQVTRFKLLLAARVRHLGLGAACSSGTLCLAMAQGPSANAPDQRIDALAPTRPHDGDDGASTDGVITQESFPPDIPTPPTQRLPAEFECQLCYQRKRFQKPSDWTKHVQEDVQPFTCTWDKCRDPKFFKRKADWVRHENEGHRHLEWWTCDMDDCRHTCFRRDNFLQHLVREHKFAEPKVKTKAALKRAGGIDATWHRVEQCHVETSTQPHEEPCRFCGKVFPTWKKLTVHLAKHMEQISLPVLRLVAAKAVELDADSVISPVPEPQAGHTASPGSQATHGTCFSAVEAQPEQYRAAESHEHVGFATQSPYVYPVMVPNQSQERAAYFASQFHGRGQSLQQADLCAGAMGQGYEGSSHEMQGPESTTGGFGGGRLRAYPNSNGLEAFPQLDALGLEGVGGAPRVEEMGYDSMMGSQGPLATYHQSAHDSVRKHEARWDESGLSFL